MIKFFKNNIKEVLDWDEQEFNIFYSRYTEAYKTFRTSSPVLYTLNYLDCALSLFLVYQNKLRDKKSFLIALILNGMYSDKNNLQPDEEQNKYLECFFNIADTDLMSLFDAQTLSNVKFLLSYSSFIDVYFDTLSKTDLELFDDFRTFFRGIKIKNENVIVIYAMDPKKIVYQKPVTADLNFDSIIKHMFSIKETIKDPDFQELYGYKITSFIDFYSKFIFNNKL